MHQSTYLSSHNSLMSSGSSLQQGTTASSLRYHKEVEAMAYSTRRSPGSHGLFLGVNIVAVIAEAMRKPVLEAIGKGTPLNYESFILALRTDHGVEAETSGVRKISRFILDRANDLNLSVQRPTLYELRSVVRGHCDVRVAKVHAIMRDVSGGSPYFLAQSRSDSSDSLRRMAGKSVRESLVLGGSADSLRAERRLARGCRHFRGSRTSKVGTPFRVEADDDGHSCLWCCSRLGWGLCSLWRRRD
jgi:hypothetical protein